MGRPSLVAPQGNVEPPTSAAPVDFAFVKQALKDFYVDWGRDPWHSVLMFKMVFLQM